YLGTFRERIYLRMTLAQMKDSKQQKKLSQHLKDYPEGLILLNGNLSDSLQDTYIQLIVKAKLKFTVVDTDLKQADDSGLLIISNSAVNEETIDITEKFKTEKIEKQPTKKTKKGFWGKLFS